MIQSPRSARSPRTCHRYGEAAYTLVLYSNAGIFCFRHSNSWNLKIIFDLVISHDKREMERRYQPRPGLREFRPGQPTDGQTCSWKVPAVTPSTFPHNATEAQLSCPQRSGEALELSQSLLEALLPSHRSIRWEIATSGHIKHWEGLPGFLRELAICCQTMYPTWLSEEICAMLVQRVRDPLSLLHPSSSGYWLW